MHKYFCLDHALAGPSMDLSVPLIYTLDSAHHGKCNHFSGETHSVHAVTSLYQAVLTKLEEDLGLLVPKDDLASLKPPGTPVWKNPVGSYFALA